MRPSFPFRQAVVAVLGASVFGCSAFAPHTQEVTINSVPMGADVKVDGVPYGPTPVTVKLQRNKDHAIIATRGQQIGAQTVGNHLSLTGALDIAGTFVFIVPVIGLFTPGAFSLDTTQVVVPLNATVAPTPPATPAGPTAARDRADVPRAANPVSFRLDQPSP